MNATLQTPESLTIQSLADELAAATQEEILVCQYETRNKCQNSQMPKFSARVGSEFHTFCTNDDLSTLRDMVFELMKNTDARKKAALAKLREQAAELGYELLPKEAQ